MKELLLEHEPGYRREYFEKSPEMFELKKRHIDVLWAKNKGNPNEIGLTLLRKHRENFTRRMEGKTPIPYTKREKEFVENEVSFDWYLEFTKNMVNDPDYLKASGIYVKPMDQFGDLEDWLATRRGEITHNGETYLKAVTMSPSGSGPVVSPEEAIYEGQSLEAMKRSAQKLPFYGEKREIDPGIADRGHKAEKYLMEIVGVSNIIERVYGIETELYPEPEAIYEHTILGDIFQGNMDGVVMNLETMQLEAVEVKSIGTTNFERIKEVKDDILLASHMVQDSSYMSIRGMSFTNHASLWGLDPILDMHVTRIARDLEYEAYLLARLLWFAIEIVIKDQDIPEEEKYLTPQILLGDLYSIYGKEHKGTSKETSDYKVITANEELRELEAQKSAMDKRHKLEKKEVEDEIAKREAIILEAIEDNERLIINTVNGAETYYARTTETKRFSSKLYDELLKSLKKGEITEEEFLEKAKERKNFENLSSKRSLKYWNKK